MQIPNEVSRKSSTKQIRQRIQTGWKNDISLTRKSDRPKITADNPRPRLQANFFWIAPIGNGDCLYTNSLAINIVGENLGLMKIPMKKFTIKKPAIYGITIKFCRMKPLINAIIPSKSIKPALPRIRLSSRTL